MALNPESSSPLPLSSLRVSARNRRRHERPDGVRTHALTHSRTHALTHSRTHALTHSRTHALTHSRTHALTHSRPHALTHSQPSPHPPPILVVVVRKCLRQVPLLASDHQLIHYDQHDGQDQQG